jgi:hypothetical protein
MPDIENGENLGETPTPTAPSEETVNLENQSDSVEPAVEGSTDQSAAQEGADQQTDKTSQQPPEHFRKGYEALERDVNEKYKPLANEVEQMGGLEVIKALAPLAEIAIDENADPTAVVEAFRSTFLPQHMEAIAWAALDDAATQDIILSDPDVLSTISQKLFNGKTIEEVQAALQYAGDVEDEDPEKAQLKSQLAKIESDKKTAADQEAARVAGTRVNDFQKRFFVDTADEVVKQFNLVAPDGASEEDKQLFADTLEDVRYAAQGRFLSENNQEYLRIQKMVEDGFLTQARVAEAKLHNKWQATLIRTAERVSKQLRNSIEHTKSSQQTKVQGVRPDVSGNAGQTQEKNQEQYDLSDPNFMNDFLAEWKAERARRA